MSDREMPKEDNDLYVSHFNALLRIQISDISRIKQGV